MTYNEDIFVDGALAATSLDGALSDKALAPIREQFEETDSKIDVLDKGIITLQERLNNAELNLSMLSERYNKAIEVINNLSERLTALESNYDPTVIGEPPANKKQGE